MPVDFDLKIGSSSLENSSNIFFPLKFKLFLFAFQYTALLEEKQDLEALHEMNEELQVLYYASYAYSRRPKSEHLDFRAFSSSSFVKSFGLDNQTKFCSVWQTERLKFEQNRFCSVIRRLGWTQQF